MTDAYLVAGEPASGKSTLGRELARTLNAVYLDLDTLTAPLVAMVAELLGTNDLDDARVARATRSRRYSALIDVAAENLSLGRDAVLSAPFTNERYDASAWRALIGPLEAAGAAAILLWLRADSDLLLARLRRRSAARDVAKLADADSYVANLRLSDPVVPHVAVEAAADPAAQVRAVLLRVQGRP